MNNITAEIITNISKKLYQNLKYPCYVDFKKQKAQFPCFFIELITSSQEQELTNRYYKEHNFDIALFTNEFGEITDTLRLENIADNLFMILEYISIDNDERLLRGTDMNYRITDNVLHFFVSYNTFIVKDLEKLPSMQSLTTKGAIKNDGN